MADEATIPAPDSAAVEAQPESTGKVYQQKDVDTITEKVRLAERKRVEAEYAEKARTAEMTELERTKKAAADEAASRQKLERDHIALQRKVAVMGKITPTSYAPPLYVETVVSTWPEGEDFDPDKAMTRASEMFASDAKASGVIALTGPAKAAPGGGGTPAGRTDSLSSMTDTELSRLALTKGAKYYEEHIKPEFDRRRRKQ
jgi:hypothetical protein